MYTLYYSPGACSMAIHVMLNSIGVPFQLEKVGLRDGGNRSPEYLKLNPRGQVPVLVEDGKAMREGGAMLIYLADKHKSSLLPSDGWERAQALQWLCFANSSLHPAYSRSFWLMRQEGIAGKDELLKKSSAHINQLWQDVENQLEGKSYICGNNISLADILLTVIANWSDHVPEPITIGPRTRALFARVIALPAYQKALETEGVSYKMAA